MSFIKHSIRSASASGEGSLSCTKMLGIDSTLTEGAPSLSRADGVSYYDGAERPGLINMVRSAVGEVSKRPGFCKTFKPENISDVYGVFVYKGISSNQYFYVTQGLISIENANRNILNSFEIQGSYKNCSGLQAGKYMFFMSGRSMYIYDCEEKRDMYFSTAGYSSIVEPSLGYLPTTYIAGKPSGEASAYQAANLLNPFIAEQYIGDGTSREFTVHYPLDFVYKAYIKDESGEWVETEVEGKDGQKIILVSAPAEPYVRGEDNVRLVYRRPIASFKQGSFPGCTCGTMFGIGGFEDRLFLSGSNFRPGYVYYSEMNNPIYFPETNYIKVGSDTTCVRALVGHGSNLSVICNDNIYSITGLGVDDDENTDYVENSVFSITSMLSTPEPVEVNPVIFDNEVSYLTNDGVCAITASGVLDERCCQIRSSYLNRFLLKENLSDCKMIAYKDFLIISNRKDTLYLLDGKQFSANSDKPFSYRQYEGYIWKGICAQYIWQYDDSLYFSDGTDIFCFDKDFELCKEYFCDEKVLEDGSVEKVPIHAYWETPEIYCSGFNLNKFFMRLGVLLEGKYRENGKPFDTDVKISARFDSDDWRTVKDYDGKRRLFDYGGIDYGRFTYKERPKSYGVYKRNLHKKGRSIKLRFENGNLNEPFTLRGFNLEYLQM